MIEIEGQTAYVRVISNNIFELYEDPNLLQLWDISSYTNYTTGGRMGVVYQPRISDFESIKIQQTFDEPDAATVARTAVGAKFDLILNIIQNGIDAGADVVFGSTYKLVLNNGARTFIDQGDPDNTDTLPGKVVVGSISGAKGRIVSLTNNDGTEGNNDTFQLIQLNGVDFIPGESITYGNFVKNKQVTIFVESGIYEEDFPIRLANNVSLKGDEFRRVIIRPKQRISQSPWANIYFFRDREFDGITLASTGAEFFNQVGELQGYFGRHYLVDNTEDINVGPSFSNPGNYTTGAAILRANKKFIQDEIIFYIDDNYPSLIFNTSKNRRDIELIVDAIVLDLVRGGVENALEVQGKYYSNYVLGLDNTGFGADTTALLDAISQISTLAGQLLIDVAPTQNGSTEPDVSLGSGETGTVAVVGNLIDKITFAFDANYNPPKQNDQMDMFLMSDATIIRNVTCQGHGGFMCVLDPEGQVLTKSPYIQTASSFSKSINAKTFSGGMYVDAFCGNIPARITNKVSPFILDLASDTGEGLFIRPPLLPCPFYIEGRRYQVNAISNYDSGAGTVRIFLDSDSNLGTGYDEDQFDEDTGVVERPLFLQTAGNRSILGNDYTNINDLGYALVTNNGAFSEMVSMFTYYCHAAYYANNGSEIRSLNGSNGYGNFGLVAEGADPNEIPDQVTLRDPMIQPCKAYTTVDTPNAFDDASIYVTDLAVPPTINSQITIDHGGATGTLNYVVSNVTNMSDSDNDGLEGDSAEDIVATGGTLSDSVYKLDLRADDVSAADFFGTLQANVADGTLIEYRHTFTHTFDGIREPSRLVTRPSTAINFDETDLVTYRSLSFSAADSLSQPLGSDEILAGLEIGYDFVRLSVDIANLTSGYGSAQGDTRLAVTPLNAEEIEDRITRDIAGRQPGDAGYAGGMIFVWAGRTHKITNYVDNSGSSGFAYIEFSDVSGTNINTYSGTGLAAAVPAAERIIFCGLDTGATAEITIAISLLRATGHDFTQIGTGSFNDSNYPNVLLGDPENPLAEAYTDAPTATSAQVWERRKGRVFFVTTDQFGFFRVGKFFSVDQATGDIQFAGEIGLTNANSLGFKRGVTINEFSADDSFSDNSGQAVPTEKATASYISRRLGFSLAGAQVQGSPTGNRIGPGFLPLNGAAALEGDIDMGSNQITNLALPGSDGSAAANKNYVDDKVNDYDQLENLRNIEFNNVAADDLLVATGKKRLVMTAVSGGSWSVGQLIGTSGGSKDGIIVDIQTATDSLLGSINIVTYTAGTGTFIIGELLYDLPGESASATIIDGPIDEIANAAEAAGSVINWTVNRTASGTTIDFQLEDNTIMNADVNASAGISQSKLAMQKANTFDEDNATTGWSGSATKIQADLGLAKFSDNNFETTEGYVRIKDNGIVFAELNQVDQYRLFGRQTSGTGNPEEVAYSDAIKFGAGLEDRDFLNSELTQTNLTILTLTGPVTVANGEVITQASSGATGTVQGYTFLENRIYLFGVTGTFNSTNQLSGSVSGALGANSVPTIISSDTLTGSALIKIAEGIYGTTSVSTGTANNSIARRTTTGALDASAIKVGGFDTLTLASSTISVKTPGGATILSAAGNNDATLITSIPGSIDVGSTGITAQSNAQGGSSYAGEGFVSADWVYASFIEAESERGETAGQTTGIGLGVGNGFSGAAANTILLIADGSPRVIINATSTTITEDLVINGDLDIDTDLNVDGSATFNGSVTLGDAAADGITINGEVIFSATGTLGSNIIPDGNGTRNLGSAGVRFGTMYANTFNGVATEAKYADLAEKYVADSEYEPGTVLVFGGEFEVTTTTSKGDHRVAGVVSTNPAYLMNSELDAANAVAVALTGRVPCKILGRVQKGDMLVTSAIAGYAVVNNDPKVGTIIGKALESKSDDGKGIIEIVVGRV